MLDLTLETDLHENSERQGPGSEEETLKALGFMDLPTDRKLKVADVGCGSGGQTMTLAQNINAHISAVDVAPDFLEELNKKTKASGLSGKVKTLEHSMENLPFEEESLDIIWSEGAIYNMGFEAGIKKWRTYLKPQGYLAVSEITWITKTRPQEIEDFWSRECPEINTPSHNIKTLEDNGYILVGYFHLRKNSWMDNYYAPLKSQFPSFLQRHNHSESAKSLVEEYEKEIEIYQKFNAYYSYGFYIARKEQ